MHVDDERKERNENAEENGSSKEKIKVGIPLRISKKSTPMLRKRPEWTAQDNVRNVMLDSVNLM